MEFSLWREHVSFSRPTNYALYPKQEGKESSGNSGNAASALLSFWKSPQPGANVLGPHFTFIYAGVSSWLWWFPGSVELPQLLLQDPPQQGSHTAKHPRLKGFHFNERGSFSVFVQWPRWTHGPLAPFSEEFSDHALKITNEVSASVVPGSLRPAAFLFSHLDGKELWRYRPPGSSGVWKQRPWVVWKGLYSFFKYSQSPMPENKTRLLYQSPNSERGKPPTSPPRPFKVTSATLTDSWN